MTALKYHHDLLKDIFAEVYPHIPAFAGIALPEMLKIAAEDHFIGRLKVTPYQLAVLQQAQTDIKDEGIFVWSLPEAVEADRADFEDEGKEIQHDNCRL